MKYLFDDLSLKISRLTTRTYSTSFSLGIYFLSSSVRKPIYAIYGLVRVADEIVDSFGDFDRKKLLSKFKQDTFEAIEAKVSTNPILNAFQQVVNHYEIDLALIEAFFASMEMDLSAINYTRESYETYILGSAEVVGLMCLKVFSENEAQYQQLKPYAMKLGAAFQKVNFMRDLKDDFEVLGRSYFPQVNCKAFNAEAKMAIEQEIELDFKEALIGIKRLPASCRSGVHLAYIYYYELFKKMKRLPATEILNKRIRINNTHKFTLMLNSMWSQKINSW